MYIHAQISTKTTSRIHKNSIFAREKLFAPKIVKIQHLDKYMSINSSRFLAFSDNYKNILKKHFLKPQNSVYNSAKELFSHNKKYYSEVQ